MFLVFQQHITGKYCFLLVRLNLHYLFSNDPCRILHIIVFYFMIFTAVPLAYENINELEFYENRQVNFD